MTLQIGHLGLRHPLPIIVFILAVIFIYLLFSNVNCEAKVDDVGVGICVFVTSSAILCNCLSISDQNQHFTGTRSTGNLFTLVS